MLIYKATELVNFAQGDLLMLGAFVAYMAVVVVGPRLLARLSAIAALVIAAFGALLDMTVLRRVIGQPQFAVVMLTIGLGAMFRTFASVTWGSEIYTLPTPFGGVTQIAGVTLSHQYLSIIVGTLHPVRRRSTPSSTTRASASPCRRPRRTSSPPTTWASR